MDGPFFVFGFDLTEHWNTAINLCYKLELWQNLQLQLKSQWSSQRWSSKPDNTVRDGWRLRSKHLQLPW